MSNHLSQLRLDEASTGLPLAERDLQHLLHCPTCADRLEELKQSAVELAQDFRSRAVARRLEEKASRVTGAQKWLPVALVAAAACVAWAVWIPSFDDSTSPQGRLKGSALTLEVVRLPAQEPISSARAGDLLSLIISAPKEGQACVATVGDEGQVTWLWPHDGSSSAYVPAGATTLNSGFRVTPGSFTLHVFLQDSPCEVNEVTEILSEAVRQSREAGRTPLEARLALPDEAYWTKTLLVEPLP